MCAVFFHNWMKVNECPLEDGKICQNIGQSLIVNVEISPPSEFLRNPAKVIDGNHFLNTIVISGKEQGPVNIKTEWIPWLTEADFSDHWSSTLYAKFCKGPQNHSRLGYHWNFGSCRVRHIKLLERGPMTPFTTMDQMSWPSQTCYPAKFAYIYLWNPKE